MEVRAYDEPDKFRAAIGDFRTADPVRHTLAITVMNRFLDDPAITPAMVTVHRDGLLSGVAFRTAPWPLVISGLPAAAAFLAELDPGLPGVTGPRELAEAFAGAWVARWRRDFQVESRGHDRLTERSAELIRRGLAHGDAMVLWEVDGEPVSWAIEFTAAS